MENRLVWIAIAAVICGVTGAASADTFRVEIDYMGDPGDGHDHMPDQIVLDAVIQMFACQGHTLILDLDDQIPHCPTLLADPGTTNCGNFWTYDGNACTYTAIRDQWFDRAGQDGWHYCIFAHDYQSPAQGGGCTTGSSGRADGGNNFIVTLGSFNGQTGTQYAQAATFAHELGHNLGLSHCGSQICGSNNVPSGDPNWVGPQVPNLPSVMSYNYQLSGVRTRMLANGLTFDEALFKEVDYSHGRMCTLNENNLDETRGTVMLPVDFNCDGATDDVGVLQDLNFGGSGGGISAPWCSQADQNRTLVSDFDEWANLSDGAALVSRALRGDGEAWFQLEERRRNEQICISSEEWARVAAEENLRGGGPTLEVESCIGGENVYIGPSFSAADGTCNLPYGGVQAAEAGSPGGSVYYFVPGTYDEAGSILLTKPGKYFCRTGSALIR